MELLLLLTRVRLFATQWTAARQAFLSFTISQSLLKLMSMESVMPSNHLILCCPLPLLPSIFPNFRVFSSESALPIRWPNIGVSASVLPVNIQGWFPLRLTGLISLLSKGLLRVFSSTTVWKHQFSVLSLLYGATLTSVHDYCKNHSFDFWDLCWWSNVCLAKQWLLSCLAAHRKPQACTTCDDSHLPTCRR